MPELDAKLSVYARDFTDPEFTTNLKSMIML